MKVIIVFAAICAVALSAPLDDSQNAKILSSESDVGPEGYKYAFDQSDGISKAEQGNLKNIGTDDEAISVQGTYTYVDKEGVTYTVNYVADENGFQPVGAHIKLA